MASDKGTSPAAPAGDSSIEQPDKEKYLKPVFRRETFPATVALGRGKIDTDARLLSVEQEEFPVDHR
jgi:hypothetical protein